MTVLLLITGLMAASMLSTAAFWQHRQNQEMREYIEYLEYRNRKLQDRYQHVLAGAQQLEREIDESVRGLA